MSRLASLGRTLGELCRVLAVFPAVERGRRGMGPRPLLAKLRARGQQAPERDVAARICLQRAIAWLDACLPGPPNCYRRALLEIALDRGAASEPLRMGFRTCGAPHSGHAWLGAGDAPGEYDAEIAL